MTITTRSFFANQPVERHRFRYLKEGSHGPLTGNDGNKTSPQFVFEVIGASADYLKSKTINCCCHLAASDVREEDIKLSPHTLELKTFKRQRGNLMPNLQPIRMVAKPKPINDTIRYEFSLHNYRIALAKCDEYKKNLTGKYKHVQLGGQFKLQDLDARCEEENGQDNGQGKGKSKGQNHVHTAYLLFIIEHNLNGDDEFYEIYFSKRILNLDNILISSVIPTYIPLKRSDTGNGTKIQLLVGDVKCNYKLHIREVYPETEEYCWSRCWSRCVESYKKIPGHNALNFVLPEFDCKNHGNESRKEIECKIYLEHGRSRSNDMDIYYEKRAETVEEWLNNLELPEDLSNLDEMLTGVTLTNNNYEDAIEDHDGNRKHKNMLQDAKDKSNNFRTESALNALKKNVLIALESLDNGLRSMVDLKEILRFICKVNLTYIRKQRSVNTLFHDAILTNNFCRADAILCVIDAEDHLAGIHRYVGSLRNFHGQTLLHLACGGHGVDLIDSLIDMWPQAVLVQDKQGETPLHAALKSPNAAAAVKKIIENEDFRGNEELLTHLLEAYNSAGHTVLHCGIQENHLPFVEMLLEHCKRSDIDACAIRSLGTGESLMHFAVAIVDADAREEMVATILKYYPDAAECVNYSKYDAYGAYVGPTPPTSESEESDDVDLEHEEMDSHEISDAMLMLNIK